MPIVMRLDRIMVEKKITSTELAAKIGISTVNLSRIKTGKIRGMRFSTLEALCQVLKCKPGDLIDYMTPDEQEQQHRMGEIKERNYDFDDAGVEFDEPEGASDLPIEVSEAVEEADEESEGDVTASE